MSDKPKKRIFIGLIVSTVFLITAVTVGLYLIPYIGLKNIHPLAPNVVCITMGALVGILMFGVSLLILTLIRGREIFWAQRLRGIVIEVLFPIMIVVGKLLGISKEKIRQSFVEVNNLLVRAKCNGTLPERILLLMPHCLQFNDCAIKITGDVYKCQACGKCKIKDLVAIKKEIDRLRVCVARAGPPVIRGRSKTDGPGSSPGPARTTRGVDGKPRLRPQKRTPGQLLTAFFGAGISMHIDCHS